MTDESQMKYLGMAVLKTEGESCPFDPDCPPLVKKIKSRKKLRKRIKELEAALDDAMTALIKSKISDPEVRDAIFRMHGHQ